MHADLWEKPVIFTETCFSTIAEATFIGQCANCAAFIILKSYRLHFKFYSISENR